MEIHLDSANPAARLIALPSESSLVPGRPVSGLYAFSNATRALLAARAEAMRSTAWENLAWLVLAASAGLLVFASLSIGW